MKTSHLKNSDVFLLLCRCISFKQEQLRECEALSDPETWPRIVAQAIDHLVAPLLHRRLAERNRLLLVSPDLAQLLRHCEILNEHRSERLRNQLLEVCGQLGAEGLPCTVLKGGAALCGRPTAAPPPAMMIDLDLLVAPGSLTDAIGCLARLGYTAIEGAGGLHSICMRHPERPAILDVHYDLGPQLRLLPVADALARLEPAGATNLWRLCPTDRVIHNIYHSQIQDRRHRLRKISLQQLTNLALILNEHGHRIDWHRVHRTFASARWHRALYSHLYCANRLLGTKAPEDPRSPWPKLHMKMILRHMDSALLKELFTGWAIVTKNLDRDRIEYDNGRQLSALDLCAKRSVIVSRALRSGPRELSRKFIVARRSRHEKIRC